MTRQHGRQVLVALGTQGFEPDFWYYESWMMLRLGAGQSRGVGHAEASLRLACICWFGEILPAGHMAMGQNPVPPVNTPISTKITKRSWFFSAFGFLASWFFGFLASWLFGFLASWLFGFSASGLFGFLALAFRILCIPSSSSAGGILAFAAFRWFMRLLAALAFCILCFLLSLFLSGLFGFCTLSFVFGCGFPHHQHHQFLPI